MTDTFFSVTGELNLNLKFIKAYELPSADEFILEIPPLFLLLQELKHLDKQNEYELYRLNKSALAEPLTQVLKNQNKKLDLVMSHILKQNTDNSNSYTTETFGASEFTVATANKINIDQYTNVTIYLKNPTAAIYAYAKTINCTEISNNKWITTFSFVHLLPQDQDILISSSLKFQQTLLRKRANERQENN